MRHAVDVPPERLEDGWSVSTLEAEAINPEPIGDLIRAVETGDYTKIDSVLIARNRKLVLEAYFNGFDRDTKHDTQSVTKSFASALAGIAIDKGLIADVDQPISQFFPGHWPNIRNEPDRKNRITLAHLLTMTSGLDAEDNWGIGPAWVRAMRRSADWYAFTLDLPMAREPGTQFSYNSPTAVLVGGVVAHSVGEPVPAFAKRYLFAPLGITDYCLSLTRNGYTATNSGFFLRPRDMLKFGQLYLDGGVWRGRRIISERWVTDSTVHQVDSARPDPTRTKPSGPGFGYLWWTRRTQPGDDPTFDMYLASGSGGQKIFVYPNLDLVVVFTGSHYGEAIGHTQIWEILDRFILPAVLNHGKAAHAGRD